MSSDCPSCKAAIGTRDDIDQCRDCYGWCCGACCGKTYREYQWIKEKKQYYKRFVCVVCCKIEEENDQLLSDLEHGWVDEYNDGDEYYEWVFEEGQSGRQPIQWDPTINRYVLDK